LRRDFVVYLRTDSFMLCACFVGVPVFRLVGVELLLRSLLVASSSVLVLKPLPSIKVRYAFDVLSQKTVFIRLSLRNSADVYTADLCI
jgi:hypothetical protein